MKYKQIFALLITTIILLTGCSNTQNQEYTFSISTDPEFGSVKIDASEEDLKQIGFEFGDSIDLKMNNGYFANDIPYFNGYYVHVDQLVLCAYPNTSNVVFNKNCGAIAREMSIQDGDTITLKLNQKAKYLEIQETFDISYSSQMAEGQTTESFCNYRMMNVGNMKEGIFYRGASPVDNRKNRAAFTDDLISRDKITFDMNLSDTEEKIVEFINDKENPFNSPYYKSLYDAKNYVALGLNAQYVSDEFKSSLASTFKEITSRECRTYVHCQEGKDRTGFTCLVIGSLAGATYEQLSADYMKTYHNYYNISIENAPRQYDAIEGLYFKDMIYLLNNNNYPQDYNAVDYRTLAEEYLLEGGMTKLEISAFEEFLCD